MNSSQRQKIKNKITQDIELIKKEIADLEEKTKPIAPDCSIGRLTRQEMIQEQQVNEHALSEARIRLNKLTYASKKVDTIISEQAYMLARAVRGLTTYKPFVGRY